MNDFDIPADSGKTLPPSTLTSFVSWSVCTLEAEAALLEENLFFRPMDETAEVCKDLLLSFPDAGEIFLKTLRLLRMALRL